MTSKKQLKIAKAMFKNSLSNGLVDANKVSDNLKEIISQRPAKLTKILRAYKRLIDQTLKKDEALVESAVPLPDQDKFEKDLKSKLKVVRVRFVTNPRVIIGAKITHGDWVYDSTLDAKLKQLVNAD